jgi:hypothetical protein
VSRRDGFAFGWTHRFELGFDRGGDLEAAGSQQWRVRRSDRQFVVLACRTSPKRAIEALLDHDVTSAPSSTIGSGG